MKVGILTQPLRNNYGGLLQNYALQFVLKSLGHEAITIDWDGRYTLKERLWRLQNHVITYLRRKTEVSKYVPSVKEDAVISRNTNAFIEKYIRRTAKAYSESSLHKYAKNQKFEAYVVGSDQVWRPAYNAFPLSMFLDFAENENVRRIAYAASFGTDKWEYEQRTTLRLKELAIKFDLITVREKTGVCLCKDYLGMEAYHVLDPTMLLDKTVYEGLVKEADVPSCQGGLFYYILDPSEEKRQIIERIAESRSLTPFTVLPKCQAENRTKDDVKHRIEDCVFPSVTSWLRGFMDAKMIIVDSFHGAVFSVIFNKPFWVIGNKKRGNARFESLLGLFGLEDRMISPGQVVDWNAPIEWARVNAIREREINRCIDLLRNALN